MEIHGERQIECNDWTFFGPPDLQMAINTVMYLCKWLSTLNNVD